jgi:succinate dehydrogenase / fumarate reductase, iron-sulfur subunit
MNRAKEATEMEKVLKICRFDPEQDPVPYFQEFAMRLEGTQTILDALLLAWQQDPSLSFRRSCRSAICGSCAVRINGQAALACQTLVQKAFTGSGPIIVEPLPHFRQLKDLVVDLEPFFESLKAVVPWLILRDGYNGRMTPEVARRLEDPATCILCGICHADLDEARETKPAAVVKALRLAHDPRDAVGLHRLRLLQVPTEILGLFLKQLPEKCPKGIKMDACEYF